MTGARLAEAMERERLYHDGINSATARLTKAAIAIKRIEPLLVRALRGAPLVEVLAIDLQLKELKRAVGLLPCPKGYTATADGGVERCAQVKP